jgi:hypothetical protein
VEEGAPLFWTLQLQLRSELWLGGDWWHHGPAARRHATGTGSFIASFATSFAAFAVDRGD